MFVSPPLLDIFHCVLCSISVNVVADDAAAPAVAVVLMLCVVFAACLHLCFLLIIKRNELFLRNVFHIKKRPQFNVVSFPSL